MILRQVVTAQNCTVEFRGQEVGYLQNFTLNCSYNLTPIRNLHQFEVQHYAQGIAMYNATAQRGFITLSDTMFGGETGLLELYNLSKEVNQGVQPNSSAYDKYQAIINAGLLLNKATKFATDIITEIGDTLSGNKHDEKGLGDLFALFDYFDILIKNPVIELPDIAGINGILDKLVGSQTNLIKLTNCKFNSRSITIAPANIMVMENVSLVALELSDYVNKIKTEESQIRNI